MSFEIKKPGAALDEKPRLSRFGRRAVAAGVIVLIVASILAYSALQANQRRKALEADVLDAIERGQLVCSNALSAVGADSAAVAALQGFVQRIGEARQVPAKAAAAQEMITYALSQVGGNQAQVDELNGARNRILLALERYENP
jgi:hypothetical protein